MSEIETYHATLDGLADPEQVNDGLRGMARDIQDWIGWFLGATGHGTHGFDASAAALVITIGEGGGLYRNVGAVAPASKWEWFTMQDDADVTCDAHDASLARVDLISISWASALKEVEPVPMYGGSIPNEETKRGSVVTVNYTAGGVATTGGFDEKPAVPAGQIGLFYVYVPASAGAVTIIDIRRPLPGPKKRPMEDPITWIGSQVGPLAALAVITARNENGGEVPTWSSGIYYQLARDWLAFLRLGPNAQNTLLNYPLCTPHTDDDATAPVVWKTYPFAPGLEGTLTNATVTLGIGSIVIARDATSFGAVWYVTMPGEARGLRVFKGRVRYQVTEAFDGTITTAIATIYLSGAPLTPLGTADLVLDSAAGEVTADFDLGAGFVVPIGQFLYVTTQLAVGTSGSAGSVTLTSIALATSEGQEPNP